jgi:hypothetical protein
MTLLYTGNEVEAVIIAAENNNTNVPMNIQNSFEGRDSSFGGENIPR